MTKITGASDAKNLNGTEPKLKDACFLFGFLRNDSLYSEDENDYLCGAGGDDSETPEGEAPRE